MPHLSVFVDLIFGGDLPKGELSLGQVAARSALVFVIGLSLVRLGKSRLIGRASALDVILGFVLGSLLSRGINGSASLSGTIVACIVLVSLHWVFTALACRSHALGSLIKGHAKVLISDGVVDTENMRSSHLSLNDLIEQLRLHANIECVDQVQVAYKERSGEVGIVKRPQRVGAVDIAVENGVKTVRIELQGG